MSRLIPAFDSKPTPRDSKTEEVRDQLPKGNPFAKKYGSKEGPKR